MRCISYVGVEIHLFNAVPKGVSRILVEELREFLEMKLSTHDDCKIVINVDSPEAVIT